MSSLPEPAAEPYSTRTLHTRVHCHRAPSPLSSSPALHRALLCPCRTPESSAMVRTRGGHRYRPRIRFSTPERDGASTSRGADAHSPNQVVETPPALAPASISEEGQASEPPLRRYQTRVGPRAPSPVHPRPHRRALPSKWAHTSGPGESSRSKPEPSPPLTYQGSSPQLSPASRIPGNVDLRAQDFHMESNLSALTADQRFRNSMRLIWQYSLLPFMTPRQFFYPWVVLEFYHTMTSRGVPSPLEI